MASGSLLGAAHTGGTASHAPTIGTPLPFALLPPCERNRSSQQRAWLTGMRCLPANTKSATWQSPEAPQPFLLSAQKPHVPEAAVAHACGPLLLYTAQRGNMPLMLRNASFWSAWLKRPTGGAAHPNRTSEQRQNRCQTRMRSWKPRICQLSRVYVAGASQVLFNETSYFGPAPRITANLQPLGVGTVQANARHAVLTRNEYGAGYYHMLFDTLASLAYLWPALKADPSAVVVLNPCSTGREHLLAKGGGGAKTMAPNVGGYCQPRSYATALLSAMGIPPERVLRWPYTRQRSGPALRAEHTSFMCAHPWQPTYHRGFWYVRQLRQLLHSAFSLPQEDEIRPRPDGAKYEPRLLLFVSRKGVREEGGDPSRNVRAAPSLMAALRRAFPLDRVQMFTGTEPVSEQARLFNKAELIAGPHGAAFANMIWCRAGTSLVEFHRLNWRAEPNSPLYAVLARSLQLRHWVIADTESESWRHGYRIAPDVLVETVRSALALAAGEGLPAGSTKVELTRDEWL